MNLKGWIKGIHRIAAISTIRAISMSTVSEPTDAILKTAFLAAWSHDLQT